VPAYYEVLSADCSVLVSLLFDLLVSVNDVLLSDLLVSVDDVLLSGLLVSVDDALSAFSGVVGGLPDLPA